MATRTTNLNLYKPVVGGDTDNWGGFLNNNAAYIDALFAKSSAAVTLHVNNQQIDGTSSYLFDSVKMGDDRQLQFGAAPDYWLIYDSSNTQFELNSTNVDGGGTDGVVFSVSDGTDDVAFTGKISTAQVDILAEGDLRLQDASGGQYVGFDAPATVSGSYTLTLPAAVGSSGQILRTSDSSGTLEWVTDQEGDLKSVADATNGGLTVTNGTGPDVTLALNFNDLSAAAVSVANDSIAIIDASDSNGTRKESIADLATAMGGTGLTGSSGTLNVDAAQTQITSVGALNAGSITSGFGNIDVGSSSIDGGTLDISGTSTFNDTVTVTKSGTTSILLTDSSSPSTVGRISNANGVLTIDADRDGGQSGSYINLKVDGTSEVAITSTGLGIGTTSPTQALDVRGLVYVESASEQLADFYSSDTDAYIRIRDSNDSLYVSSDNGVASFGGNTGAHAGNLNVSLTSGAVGIGTTSPSGTFDAQNNQNNTSHFYFRNTDTTDTSSRSYLNIISGNRTFQLGAINADHAYINAPSGANLYFQDGGSTNMTIEADGTVNVGGDWLDVADGITTIGGTDTSKLRFHNAAGTLRSFLTLNGTSLEIDTDSALIFSPNNSERARIDDSGRFGLGTASPHNYYSGSNKFVIANTGGSTGMTFATSNTGQARIDFAEGTSGAEQYRGTISYNHAATESEGYLRFVAGGAEALRLGSNYVLMGNLPTSDPGVATALYNDSGTLKISAG